jgi:hypothetical protein
MCHEKSAESKEAAGAPETEIEVTSAMIDEGMRTLCIVVESVDVRPMLITDNELRAVYISMRRLEPGVRT